MKILVVAATAPEIAIFQSKMPANVQTLVTGVGMTATTYALAKHLQTHQYDLVLQAGVGGSFDRSLALGSLVFVTQEHIGDLGAEDHEEYIDLFGLGLADRNKKPYTDGVLLNKLTALHQTIDLPQVSGITVNTVSGNERTIARREQMQGSVESMEGAAFHYVCIMENVPFAQVRSISNYVIPRDKSQWKMKEAIINLNDWLIKFTASL
jgi:futalosine hydrolase